MLNSVLFILRDRLSQPIFFGMIEVLNTEMNIKEAKYGNL